MASRPGRRSKIRRLAPEVRQVIERMLREDRLTLREMIATLEAQFPDEELPSRSGLHRYQTSFAEMTRRMREQKELARVLVAEIGEEPDEKAGALLAETVMAAAQHVALKMHGDDDATVEDVRKLARAASYAIDASGRVAKAREAAQRAAREAAAQDAESAARDAGLSDDTVKSIRDRIMGVH